MDPTSVFDRVESTESMEETDSTVLLRTLLDGDVMGDGAWVVIDGEREGRGGGWRPKPALGDAEVGATTFDGSSVVP